MTLEAWLRQAVAERAAETGIASEAEIAARDLDDEDAGAIAATLARLGAEVRAMTAEVRTTRTGRRPSRPRPWSSGWRASSRTSTRPPAPPSRASPAAARPGAPAPASKRRSAASRRRSRRLPPARGRSRGQTGPRTRPMTTSATAWSRCSPAPRARGACRPSRRDPPPPTLSGRSAISRRAWRGRRARRVRPPPPRRATRTPASGGSRRGSPRSATASRRAAGAASRPARPRSPTR